MKMAYQICFCCFKFKGDYEVCRYCGYDENTAPEQACQLAPGTILRNRYIMGTALGIGGFGITYKAFDTKLGVVVAVKEFYPAGLVNRGDGETKVGVFSGEKESGFRRQLERFLEEARNMALFSKEEDIVNVYDFFEENQTAYMIMEYVDAPLLKNQLRDGGLSPQEALGYMLSILNALEKIHSQGIIHRDISPDNIFLTGTDTIKLFDFGAAKFQKTGSGRTEAVVIKTGYAPPEQYMADGRQDISVDIYAAGAVFYEMVTGVRPMDALDRMEGNELKRPGVYDAGIDAPLERMILKAMALEPELRFQTAEQFKKVLQHRFLVELPEETMRRQHRRKQLFMVGLAVTFIITGGILFFSQIIFSGRGKIDPSKVEAEHLTVWIMAEDQAVGTQMAQALEESVAQEYPQLAVEAEAIDSRDYEGKLLQAAKQNRLPDVFCLDSLLQSDMAQPDAYCADLSRLLHTMHISAYMYLERFAQKDHVYALPTAVQTAVVYVNTEKTEDLPEFLSIEMLHQKTDTLVYADEEHAFLKFQDTEDAVCWIAGDLDDLEEVKTVTVEQVPSTGFAVVPVLNEDRLTGNFKGWYGVKKSADKNREKAGMLLLSLLLSDGMQMQSYMENMEGLPLNRAALENYKETKLTTYLSFLKNYKLDDMQLYDEVEICSWLRKEKGGDET